MNEGMNEGIHPFTHPSVHLLFRWWGRISIDPFVEGRKDGVEGGQKRWDKEGERLKTIHLKMKSLAEKNHRILPSPEDVDGRMDGWLGRELTSDG